MTTPFLRQLFQRLWSHRVTPQEIKREAFALGGRHMGEVMIGARQELALPGVSFRRGMLLQAVMRREGAAAKAARLKSRAHPVPAKPEGWR